MLPNLLPGSDVHFAQVEQMRSRLAQMLQLAYSAQPRRIASGFQYLPQHQQTSRRLLQELRSHLERRIHRKL
ncbi:hypothetical protein D9M70_605070 [compost metagenome]